MKSEFTLMKFVFSISFLLMCLLYGCQENAANQYEPQVVHLEQRIKKAECDKAALQKQIDSVWHIAVSAMEQDLPKDIEAGTKSNFLGLKAEHLIKMLPEYAVMKKETKQLISEAARLDSVLTLQFNTTLLGEFQAYETEMKAFLKEVETRAPDLRQKYLIRLQAAQKASCNAG